MNLKIDHPCPQCGGPVSLEETDRVLSCPFCRVRLHILSKGPFRYALAPPESLKGLVFIPYWRFKGTVFSVSGTDIRHRLVDTTGLAAPFAGLPASLGLRPQALRLVFAARTLAGRRAVPATAPEDAVKMMEARYAMLGLGAQETDILEKTYVGDTTGIVYAPYLVQNGKLVDAFLKTPAATAPEDLDRLLAAGDWDPGFIPAICPRCGADLDGERDTFVFVCRNCDSAWRAHGGAFARVAASVMETKAKNALFLPFWRVTPEITGIALSSLADFARFANLPKAVKPEWADIEFSFYCPAFKLNPRHFLRLARQITCSPPLGEETERLRMDGEGMLPANLPLSEAVDVLKVLLAETAVPRRKVFPRLPEIIIKAKKARLVFAPFVPQGSGAELVGEGLGFVVPKKALQCGQDL